MRNSKRVTELEAKTQTTPTEIRVYYHEDNIYTTEDGRGLTDEEIEDLLCNDENNAVNRTVVEFVE